MEKALGIKAFVRSNPGLGQLTEVVWSDRSGKAPVIRLARLKGTVLDPGGLVTGPGGEILSDALHYESHLSILKEELEKKRDYQTPKNLLQGRYMILLGPWCDGFWHWMLQFLPRALVAEQAGFDGQYIVAPTAPKFVTESMALLGIAPDRLLTYDINDPLSIEELWLPQRLGDHFDPTYIYSLFRMRQRILKEVTTAQTQRRIYISRKAARNQRRILNEDEVMDLLTPFGFESVCMETLSLQAQIEMVAGSHWLIGGSGAGLSHALFMPFRSGLVELFSPTYINPCTLSIVKMLRHDYAMMPAYNNRDYTWGEDIQVFLPVLEMHLENRLNTQKPYGWM